MFRSYRVFGQGGHEMAKGQAKTLGKSGIWLAVLAVATTILISVSPAQAATFTVTSLGDSGAGSLRDAIDQANGNGEADTITFNVTGTITLTSGQLTVTEDLTIEGPGQTDLTISGNNASRVLQVFGGVMLNLEEVTIADGNAIGGSGGGILNSGTLNVTNSTFTGNSANSGGGIFNNGTLTVTGSTLSDNSANSGGGIWNGLWTNVIGSTLAGNSASGGGGIENDDGGRLAVTNSTLSENDASAGGGILNIGVLDVTNSTLSENSGSEAGGIHNEGVANLYNTIVANSIFGDNCFLGINGVNDGGGNLSWPDASCPGINEDPLLDPDGLQDNGGPTQTIALLAGSPAIDAAVEENCPATDQRGVHRPQGEGCDIGAFELAEVCVILIQEKWNALSGAPGAPQGDVIVFPGGMAQNYEVGRLICNEAAGAAFWLFGPILEKYDEIGAYTSPLRLPVSDVFEYKVQGQTAWARATFQGGWIYWTQSTGALWYRNATSYLNGW